MKISNSLEDVVPATVERLIADHPHIGTCDDCASDVLAFTMSRLRPGYTSTELGRVLTRISAEKAKGSTEITITVLNAIKVIEDNPHHESKHN